MGGLTQRAGESDRVTAGEPADGGRAAGRDDLPAAAVSGTPRLAAPDEVTAVDVTVEAVAVDEAEAVAGSFDAVFTAEYRQMVRLAVALCGNVAASEEVVQDAFAAAWPRWATLDRPGAYVQRAVVNGATDLGRRRVRRRERDRSLRVVGDTHAAPPADPLWDVIDALPTRQRQAVVLRYFVDLTVPEIAGLMGRPLGTVKSDLHRALTTLAEEVER